MVDDAYDMVIKNEHDKDISVRDEHASILPVAIVAKLL
jgi:hypothetical protein